MNIKNIFLLSFIALSFVPNLVCAQPSIKLPLLVKQESLAPLFFASIRERNNEGLKSLIACGIDVSTMHDDDGKLGVDVAVEVDNKEAFRILILAFGETDLIKKKKASLKKVMGWYPGLPIPTKEDYNETLFSAIGNKDNEILSNLLLLKCLAGGADVNCKESWGKTTPLMLSADLNDIYSLGKFLVAGAHVNAVHEDDQKTALDYAFRFKDMHPGIESGEQVISLLRRYKAKTAAQLALEKSQ